MGSFSRHKYIPPHGLERQAEAAAVYQTIAPLLEAWTAEGVTQDQIAQRLNELGHRTREGRAWTQVQVGRVIKYVGTPTAPT